MFFKEGGSLGLLFFNLCLIVLGFAFTKRREAELFKDKLILSANNLAEAFAELLDLSLLCFSAVCVFVGFLIICVIRQSGERIQVKLVGLRLHWPIVLNMLDCCLERVAPCTPPPGHLIPVFVDVRQLLEGVLDKRPKASECIGCSRLPTSHQNLCHILNDCDVLALLFAVEGHNVELLGFGCVSNVDVAVQMDL